jgi:hypothetical protein
MRIESQGTKNFKKFMLKAKKINYSKNLKNLYWWIRNTSYKEEY